MKKIFTLIFGLLMAQWALAATEVNGLYYNLNTANKTATVTYHDGYDTSSSNRDKEDNINYTETSITIPASISVENVTYTVVGVSNYAFCNSRSLEKVTIEAPVTSIGTYSFSGCTQLSTINIPAGLTSIPSYCFNKCSSLSSLSLPESINTIGDYAFQDCVKLSYINIPSEVKIIPRACFANCAELKEIILPAGLQQISGQDNFYGCSQLCSINIPDGVTKIPNYCFRYCSSLTSLNLPDGVISIGSYAFDGCSRLTSINIPDGVTEIPNNCFFNCSSLTSLELPLGITSIGVHAFYGCSQLASINIPDGVTEIPNNCFLNCSSLTSLELPLGITSIGEHAFQGCAQLSSINIPNGVTKIRNSCFYNCSSLTSLTLPDGVISIEDYAFSGCSKLASINIPDGVTEIMKYCFYNCRSLPSLTLPEGVTSIGESAFYGCSRLTSINIPDGVTKIPNYCFEYCSSLTSLQLPEGVTSIGNSAFFGCSQLASINIPDGVTSIPSQCFSSCSSLTSLTLPQRLTSIGIYAFVGSQLTELIVLNPEPPTTTGSSFPWSGMKTVYVPYGAKAAYEAADIWKNYNIVELPGELDGTLEIEDFAIEANGTAETNLSFIGELRANRYPGFQFFLTMPDGISVSEITLGDNLSSAGFQLSHNDLTENPVKVVVFNTTGATSEETVNLLNITFSASDNAPNGESVINLTKAYFSTSKGEDLPLDDSQTTVTISNIPVESFEISPKETADIYVGQEYSFTATVKPENATNKSFEWTLDEVDGEDPVVEIIKNENGEITVKGLRLGKATLTATAADFMGATATATVNVVPTPAQSVTVSAEDMILLVGTTGQLSATVSPEDTTDKTINWSSENEATATVSEEGLVTAVAPGTVIIKATCGEVSGICEVTVKAIESTTVKPGNGEDDGDDDDNTSEGDENKTPGENTENGMSVNGNDLTLRVGQKGSITLDIEPGVNYDPQLVWTLADGGNAYVMMTVNGENSLTASFEGLSVGTTTYTVSTPANQASILTGKINVIAENPVMSLTVSPEEISLPKNASAYHLEATITPDVVTNGTLSWSSNSESVATVDASGNVTPVGEGECMITVSTTDGTGLTATCKVTVTAPIDDNFTFEFDNEVMGGAEGISIYIGSTYQFKPKAKEGYVLPDVIAWSSSNATTVSVEDNGTIHGLQLGKASITATATVNGKEVTASCDVTVIAVPAASISIDGGGVKSIKQTETLELTATVLPENTTYPDVTWESSESGIATVSQEGVVTGVEPGQVTITAYVTAQPNVRATYDITVGKLLLGDSNDNGIVTVADVVTTANYLIDEPIVDWCFVNADVIGDNKITPADVTATVDIIINDTDYMSRRSARAVGATNGVDRLVADNFRNGQNEARIEVKLDNSMAYSALMATVAIPQGMQIKEVVKGPRAADHVLMYNINDAGDLKIVLFSYTNATFGEGGDALFTIVASTEGVTDNIEMFNIIASDASSTDYDLGFDGGLNESQATGIGATEGSDIIILAVAEGIEVLNAEGQQIGIYSLEGANMASKLALSGREKFELLPGIYVVIAGQTTAKVLVK